MTRAVHDVRTTTSDRAPMPPVRIRARVWTVALALLLASLVGGLAGCTRFGFGPPSAQEQRILDALYQQAVNEGHHPLVGRVVRGETTVQVALPPGSRQVGVILHCATEGSDWLVQLSGTSAQFWSTCQAGMGSDAEFMTDLPGSAVATAAVDVRIGFDAKLYVLKGRTVPGPTPPSGLIGIDATLYVIVYVD